MKTIFIQLFFSLIAFAGHVDSVIEVTAVTSQEKTETPWAENQTLTCRNQNEVPNGPISFAEELSCELARNYTLTNADGTKSTVTKPIERAFIGLYISLQDDAEKKAKADKIAARLHLLLWENSKKKFSQVDGSLIEESDSEVSKLLIELFQLAGLSPLPKEITPEKLEKFRAAWPQIFQKRLMLPTDRRALSIQIVRDAVKLTKETTHQHRLWESLKPLEEFSGKGIPDLTSEVLEPVSPYSPKGVFRALAPLRDTALKSLVTRDFFEQDKKDKWEALSLEQKTSVVRSHLTGKNPDAATLTDKQIESYLLSPNRQAIALDGNTFLLPINSEGDVRITDKAGFEWRRGIYEEAMKRAGLKFTPAEGFSLLPDRNYLDLSEMSIGELEIMGLKKFKFSSFPILPLADGRFLIGIDLSDENTYRVAHHGKYYPATKEELEKLPEVLEILLKHKGYEISEDGKITFDSVSHQQNALEKLREPYSEDRRLLEMYQPGLADLMLGTASKASILTGIKNNFWDDTRPDRIFPSEVPPLANAEGKQWFACYEAVRKASPRAAEVGQAYGRWLYKFPHPPQPNKDEPYAEQLKLYELSLQNFCETSSEVKNSSFDPEKVAHAKAMLQAAFSLAERGIIPVSAPIPFRRSFRELALLNQQITKFKPGTETYLELLEAKALLTTYLKDVLYIRSDGFVANNFDGKLQHIQGEEQMWSPAGSASELRSQTVTQYNKAYHEMKTPRNFEDPKSFSPMEVIDTCRAYQTAFLSGTENVRTTNETLYTRGGFLGIGNTVAERLWDPVLGRYTANREAHEKAILDQYSYVEKTTELANKDERFRSCALNLNNWYIQLVQADFDQAEATLTALRADFIRRFSGAAAAVVTLGVGSAISGALTGVAETTGGYVVSQSIIGAGVGAAAGAASYSAQIAALKYIDKNSDVHFSGTALAQSVAAGGAFGAIAPVFPNLSQAVGAGYSYIGGGNAGVAADQGKYGLAVSETFNLLVLPAMVPAARKLGGFVRSKPQASVYTPDVIGPRTAGTTEIAVTSGVVPPAKPSVTQYAHGKRVLKPTPRQILDRKYFANVVGGERHDVSPLIAKRLNLPETHRIPEYILPNTQLFHQNISNQQRVELLGIAPLGDVMSAPGHAILRSPQAVKAISAEMAKPNWVPPQSWREEPMVLNVVTESGPNGTVKVRAVELQDGNHRFAAGLDSGRWKTLGDIPEGMLQIKVNGHLAEGKGRPVRWIPLDVVKRADGIPWTDVSSSPYAKGPTAQVEADISSIDPRFSIEDRGVRIEEVLSISLMRLNSP